MNRRTGAAFVVLLLTTLSATPAQPARRPSQPGGPPLPAGSATGADEAHLERLEKSFAQTPLPQRPRPGAQLRVRDLPPALPHSRRTRYWRQGSWAARNSFGDRMGTEPNGK